MQNSNLLQSPGNGPPIAKKQRGGATPGSIKSRSRGPPMSSNSNANSNTNTNRSRARARASGPPSGPPPGEVVDDAIARRRAELRRLQEKARGAMGSASTSTSTAKSLVRSKGPPQGPPQGIAMSKASKRTSDIFPTAPKSPSMIPKPTAKSNEATMAMAMMKQPPLAATTTTTSAKPNPNPNLPPETPQNNAIPPTPAVGRRLEFPSSQKAAAAATTTTSRKPPPSRSHPNSPTKAVSSTTSSFSVEPTATTATATANIKSAPLRAKSAPPKRPPGPPPQQPSEKSTSSKVKAKKKVKARTNRPAPVRPNTLSLLPTVKTKSPKSEASSPEKKEKDNNSESESQPPIVEPTENTAASSKPPPPTIADTNIGKGSLDTSKLTETPTGQKSIAPTGNGADTPPSSGSSARRRKLQLMRQQALVASSLKSDKPPTKNSFYTGSTGEPATAAFAKAIAPKEITTTTTTTPPVIPNLASARPDENKKPPMQSAAQARLEDAYKKSEQEKMRALVKIKELEDKLSQSAKEQLQKSKQETKQQQLNVQTLLSLAETQGPEAALIWAKNNSDGNSILPTSPSKPASRTGFDTGMGATPRKLPGTSLTMQPTPHRRARMAIRALQARPQNQPPDMQQESPEATERRLIRQFKEAVRFVSYEFSSELATYIVRRPYGIPTNPQGLFDHCRPPTEKPEAYQKRAHVSDKTSIEVAAIVKADNTPLLVFGVAGIRYQTNPNRRNVPPEWKHFEDVDAEDRPLGHVTYIDGQANEKEYSLDEILEEALLVREQYCGTLTSTAMALPDLKQQQQQQQQPPAQKEEPEPQQPQKQQQPQQQQKQQQQQPPPDTDIDSGSSDVLVVFLGMVVSFVFNLIYGIFIGTPLKILRTCFVLVVASVVLQTLHLYLADGYNEWALREFTAGNALSCSSFLASDLSWFSNQHPGIL